MRFRIYNLWINPEFNLKSLILNLKSWKFNYVIINQYFRRRKQKLF
jgi:hypothetical protein